MSHNYKSFIEITTEKADLWWYFCICIACRDIEGRQVALLKKMPNKSNRIRNHFKKCNNFKNKYPQQYIE